MPEVQLSFHRIREHLRKRWYLYLIGIALMCFLNELIYTVTRPRIPERALLRVMLVNVDAPEAELDALAEKLLPAAQAAEPELRRIEFEALQYLGENDVPSTMLLTTRFVSGGADLYITDAAGFAFMVSRGYCAALDAAAWQDAQADPDSESHTAAPEAEATRGAESHTAAPEAEATRGAELMHDPETGESCAVRLDAGTVFQNATGEIHIFVSAGSDNPAAAEAILQSLATGVN